MLYWLEPSSNQYSTHQPVDGRNNGRNMLVRKLLIKYIMNLEVHFVGYLYITDLINARKMLRIKTVYTRVGTLIVATIYLQLIQNRYIFRSLTVLQCSHQHCVQPVASDVEVVGYL